LGLRAESDGENSLAVIGVDDNDVAVLIGSRVAVSDGGIQCITFE
jgi:hypothetical protein